MMRGFRGWIVWGSVLVCIAALLGTWWMWEASCIYATSGPTPVYTPGTSEIAVMLPAGTAIHVEATVGDAWQEIEYLFGGQCRTGFVRAGSLTRRVP